MQILYETERIILALFNRELIQESNSDYRKWMFDKDVTRFNHWGLFPHSKKKEEAFLDMCESGEGDLVLAIMVKTSEEINIEKHHWSDHLYNNLNLKHIGNLSLQSINKIYRSAEYAITIGDKNYWQQGIGYEASKLLFHHGFNRLNLHRIWSATACVNKGMLRLFEKLKMQKEGIFKQGMFINGQYTDIIAYAIIAEEWRKNAID